MSERAFRLTGPGAAAALDLLHVHADVRGAIEGEHAVTVWLAGGLPPVELPGVAVEELPPDAGPAATGLERDAPIHVGPDLVVRPPWVARPAGFAGLELIVPRGMAFGSGEHASTKAALLALHSAWSDPATFADVGTGSGILALYADRRGCPRIEACDVDPVAVAVAAGLVGAATVVRGGPEALPWPADLVVANMTGDEIGAALPGILSVWTGRGPLVLSGLRGGEVDTIRARLPGTSTATAVEEFTALVCRQRPA